MAPEGTSSNPKISISLPQIYHATGTVPERSDAERIGLIPESIRLFPNSLFSTAHAHLQVQPQSPPHQGRAGLHVISYTGLGEKGTCSESIWRSTNTLLKQGARLARDASGFGCMAHLRSFPANNKRPACRPAQTAHKIRLGRSQRCWSLRAHAARIGETRIAQLNAEPRDFASTIEMKCFDQRALRLKDI